MNVTSLTLAQAVPQQQSFADWYVAALVNFTGLGVFMSTALLFAGAVCLVRTKQPLAALAAYLVFLPLPTLIALIGQMQGMSFSLIVIASSPQGPSQQDYAAGFACTLLSLATSVMLTAPTYALLAFCLITRTMRPQRGVTHDASNPVTQTPLLPSNVLLRTN